MAKGKHHRQSSALIHPPPPQTDEPKQPSEEDEKEKELAKRWAFTLVDVKVNYCVVKKNTEERGRHLPFLRMVGNSSMF